MSNEIATTLQSDYQGNVHGGLQLTEIDRYTIVDDGQDIWLALSTDFRNAVVKIIADAKSGKYDDCEPDEVQHYAYIDLCRESKCIYSRSWGDTDLVKITGSHSDLARVAESIGFEVLADPDNNERSEIANPGTADWSDRIVGEILGDAEATIRLLNQDANWV